MSVPIEETKSEVTAELEEKVEETEEKLADAKANPEYATKEDITSLTALLAEFRTELTESKKTPEKPKVPAPEKKAAPKPKVEETKPEVKEEVKEPSYGSRRWFGGR